MPDGFETGMTGTGKATEWSLRTVDRNRVLAHVGFWDENPDGVLPVCWVHGSAARDLTLKVRLFPVVPPAGIPDAHHDGAGIVVRFRDPDNYYLLRAVPRESPVRLYTVVKGKRTALAGKTLDVAIGAWHDLALKARANVFTASFDGKELFRHTDDTFGKAGAFGLWSKPSNVTYVDDPKANIAD